MGETIEIIPYDPAWPSAFTIERDRIAAALGTIALRIDHNGSTSVPGLAAKPIIDIQVSARELQPMETYAAPLTRLGYVHVPHSDDSFCPFFHRPKEWPHTHHVHVVQSGGDEERRTLAFRDYLRAHQEVALEYEKLKRTLASHHNAGDFPSREAYADAKTEFITSITYRALKNGFPRGVLINDSPLLCSTRTNGTIIKRTSQEITMTQENAHRLLDDPVAQELLKSKIPARLAYAGPDGSPRVVPIWFHWDGTNFVLGTAPDSPKVKAIGRNEKVALTIDEDSFPPKVLLVRGTAKVQVIDGVVSEYAQAARRYLGEEQGAAWEQQAKGMFKQMARVTIQPEWVKILDFQTRFPRAIEEATSGAK